MQQVISELAPSGTIECSQFADKAKVEKCEQLNQLVAQYKADMTALQENPASGVFSKTMQLNQYRDDHWQHNYNNSTRRDEIHKIQKNLNSVVKNMAGEYNETARIANDRTQTIKDYEDVMRFQEEELARLEDRADAAQDRLTLRNRIVSINNAAARRKTKIIYLLKVFFFICVFLIPAFVAFLADAISIEGFFAIFLLMCVVYIAFVIYELYYAGDSNLKRAIEADVRKFDKRFYRFGKGMEKAFKHYVKAKCSECVGDPRDWEFGGRGYVPVTPST